VSEQDNATTSAKIFSFFDQGKKFTEDLLKENERLRHRVAELANENEVLVQRAEANGVAHMQNKIRVLETDIDHLQQEIERQKQLAADFESENREFADRYVEIERQNTNLINMYVASYQLHSTLDFSSVIVIVRDIVINMLGAEIFGIYLVDEKIGQLVLAAHEDLPEECRGNLAIDEEMNALLNGPVKTDLGENPSGSPLQGGPIAEVPLQLDDRPVGLIRIYKLLIQKQGLQTVDFELFELLCKHASTAIYSSQLHARSERKRATLEGVVEFMRSTGVDSSESTRRPPPLSK
jgi:hypothetical protein